MAFGGLRGHYAGDWTVLQEPKEGSACAKRGKMRSLLLSGDQTGGGGGGRQNSLMME